MSPHSGSPVARALSPAVRRRAGCKRDEAKPLSLEYMADRLDVDDPLFGYLAFTKSEGWLQGYVTATSFTTWNRSFRWDSTDPCLDLHDHEDDVADGALSSTAKRKVDEDGTLSFELAAEVSH